MDSPQTQICLYCHQGPGGVPEDVVCGIGPVGKEEISVLKPSIGELLGIVHTLVESHNCCHFVGPAFQLKQYHHTGFTPNYTGLLIHTSQISLHINLLEVLEVCIWCM